MLINALENAEVCSVIFIRDYLQFYFEGEQNNATLTLYSMPISVVNGQYFDSSILGYRDCLCSFINHQVRTLEIKSGQYLKITFDHGDKLEVSLKKEDCIGQEAAMLRVENQIAIW